MSLGRRRRHGRSAHSGEPSSPVERYAWLATVLGLERTVRALGIVAERLGGLGAGERAKQTPEPSGHQSVSAAPPVGTSARSDAADTDVLVFSDLDAAKAARAMDHSPTPTRSSTAHPRPALPHPESIRGALRRTEAATYVGLSLRAFDKHVRRHIPNRGLPRRPLYLIQDLDIWLRRNPLGPFEGLRAARAITSVSATAVTVTNPARERQILSRLRNARPKSTPT